MKIRSSGAAAGAMLIKRRAPKTELCHFYGGSAAQLLSTIT